MVSAITRVPSGENVPQLHDLFPDESSTLIASGMSRVYPLHNGRRRIISGLRKDWRDGKLFDDALNFDIPRMGKLVPVRRTLDAVRVLWCQSEP